MPHLDIMHAILLRFSCIPLVNIEVILEDSQAGDLQIWFIPLGLASLSVRTVMEQALIYSYFTPAAFSEELRCSVRSLYTGWQDRS